MAEKSGFFNSSSGDRKYKAEFFAEYFAAFISNGVYPNPSTQCQVLANDDMTVTLQAGKALLNGYYYCNDSDLIFTIDAADGVLNRIDRIVLQFNTLDRTITAKVKQGEFASTPAAIDLQRDADAYELGIADITVSAGVISITQSAIADLRLSETYCGISHGIIDQVDTETLFLQYQAWYLEKTGLWEADIEQIKADYSSDFEAWFTTIQGILDEEAAGNLLLLIQENQNDIELLKAKPTTTVISTTWDGESLPYTQTFINTDVTANNDIDISLAPTATQAETEAFNDLDLKDGGQTAGSFTVRNWGTNNLIEIPVIIKVRGE